MANRFVRATKDDNKAFNGEHENLSTKGTHVRMCQNFLGPVYIYITDIKFIQYSAIIC